MNKFYKENNVLFEIKVGSHLYGLNTPTSDEDFMGVYIPPVECIFGLKDRENEMDLSVVDKHENGKNTGEAIDRKFLSLHKYLRLAMENNPNILETLFATGDSVIFSTPLGDKIFANRDKFVNKKLVYSFLGYARSQRNKMVVKRDNYFALKNALDLLKTLDVKEPMVSFEGREDFSSLFTVKNGKKASGGQHYQVADMAIPRNVTVKRAYKQIFDRIGQATNRVELIKSRGYDTKFAHHLIRLLLECRQMIRTKTLVLPITGEDKEILMAIKNGEWKLDKVLEFAIQLEDDLKVMAEETVLPEPNFEWLNEFMIDIYREFYEGGF